MIQYSRPVPLLSVVVLSIDLCSAIGDNCITFTHGMESHARKSTPPHISTRGCEFCVNALSSPCVTPRAVSYESYHRKARRMVISINQMWGNPGLCGPLPGRCAVVPLKVRIQSSSLVLRVSSGRFRRQANCAGAGHDPGPGFG